MKAASLATVLWLLAAQVCAGMADPTRPGHMPAGDGSPVNERPSFRLQYVAVGPSGATAIINGEHVRVGDRVSGARVLSIQAGRVALRHAGERIELRLDHPSIRRKRGP